MQKEYQTSAFEKDSNSPMGELFLKLHDFIRRSIGNDAQERSSQNITTLFSREGGFCYIKAYEGHIHIGWFRGRYINDKYNQLFGSGKTIRGQKIYKLDHSTKEIIKYYIDETLIFLIEHNELMKIKKQICKRGSPLIQ